MTPKLALLRSQLFSAVQTMSQAWIYGESRETKVFITLRYTEGGVTRYVVEELQTYADGRERVRNMLVAEKQRQLLLPSCKTANDATSEGRKFQGAFFPKMYLEFLNEVIYSANTQPACSPGVLLQNV